MQSVSTVVKRSMLAIIPDRFKDWTYRKVSKDETYTITIVVYSVYPVKDKESGEFLLNRRGEPVLNCTAYIGFDDGTYTTSKGDTVISQLVSETGNYPDTAGYHEFPVDNCRVKIIETMAEYGKAGNKKSFPIWCFEPL